MNEDLENTSPNTMNNIEKYCKTIVEPTIEELKLHKDLLKKEIKKNYYWITLFWYSSLKSILSSILIFLNPDFSNNKTNKLLISG